MWKIKSKIFPHLFLSFSSHLFKDLFSVTKSIWSLTDKSLSNIYQNKTFIISSIKLNENTFKFCYDSKCLDAWDNSDKVILYPSNNNLNQQWIIISAEPILPNINELSKKWSPKSQILKLQKDDYQTDFLNRRARSYIFYLKDSILPSEISVFLSHIPLVTTNGDKFSILPNFQSIGPITLDKVEKYNLLNYDERRRARKMIIISDSKVFAWGGYNSQVNLYSSPRKTFIISIAAPQFEFRKLEYRDFIVNSEDSAIINPLFPQYYSNGNKPSFEQAKLDQRNKMIDDDTILLTSAYFKSTIQDLTLILFSFNHHLKLNESGWLKLTALGMGFFAQLDIGKSIANLLIPIFLLAITTILTSWSSAFPKIKVIEFPDFTKNKVYHLNVNQINGINLVHTRYRDLLDFNHPEYSNYTLGIVNPSDVFSYKGNEFGYGSVEAMIGNNTDLRYNQVLAFNPYLRYNHMSVNFN